MRERDGTRPPGTVADMPTGQPKGTRPSPAPADGPHLPDPAPPRWDPVAERDARRQAREARRSPQASRPEARPKRRRRLPVERILASAAIVGIVVVMAAVVGSQSGAAWLVGLVCAIVTLLLVAVLPHAAADRAPDRRR